ncbi:type II secretion system GspH family protein [Vibrio parahaemolyticus]|nr:type II secretion system GspH family protein [Vibrio parahaemolyticus]
MRGSRGFTLIELIMCIIILGVVGYSGSGDFSSRAHLYSSFFLFPPLFKIPIEKPLQSLMNK